MLGSTVIDFQGLQSGLQLHVISQTFGLPTHCVTSKQELTESRLALHIACKPRMQSWKKVKGFSVLQLKQALVLSTSQDQTVDAFAKSPELRNSRDRQAILAWTTGLDHAGTHIPLPELCDEMTLVTLPPQSILFQQGAACDALYVVYDGSIGLYRKPTTVNAAPSVPILRRPSQPQGAQEGGSHQRRGRSSSSEQASAPHEGDDSLRMFDGEGRPREVSEAGCIRGDWDSEVIAMG